MEKNIFQIVLIRRHGQQTNFPLNFITQPIVELRACSMGNSFFSMIRSHFLNNENSVFKTVTRSIWGWKHFHCFFFSRRWKKEKLCKQLIWIHFHCITWIMWVTFDIDPFSWSHPLRKHQICYTNHLIDQSHEINLSLHRWNTVEMWRGLTSEIHSGCKWKWEELRKKSEQSKKETSLFVYGKFNFSLNKTDAKNRDTPEIFKSSINWKMIRFNSL